LLAEPAFFAEMSTEGRFKGAQLRGTHAMDHEWT
jgi:hypothetical protein